jgi:uncharacterized protein YraI
MAFSGTTARSAPKLRAAPSVNAPIIATLAENTPVNILAQAGDWLHVRAEGREGYLFADCVQVQPIVRRLGKVNTRDGLNLRRAPATTQPILRVLSFETELEVLGEPTDGWLRVRFGEIEGFVAAQYVTIIESRPEGSPVRIPPLEEQSIGAPPNLIPPLVRGVHASAGGWAPNDAELKLIRANNIGAVMIVAYEAGQARRAITLFRGVGVQHFVIRAATHTPLSADPNVFINATLPILREYQEALGGAPFIIQIHNEPNLRQEGWQSAWADGQGFTAWFLSVLSAYRQAFPTAKLGYPALSPGIDVFGVRLAETAFMAQSLEAVRAADWFAVHAYWQQPDGSDLITPVAQWRAWAQGKPIIATEVGPSDRTPVTALAVRRAYARFASIGIPMMAWLLHGAGAWHNADWTLHDIRI